MSAPGRPKRESLGNESDKASLISGPGCTRREVAGSESNEVRSVSVQRRSQSESLKLSEKETA